MKVAIQGQQGSYHHQVADELFGTKIQIVYCNLFPDVFEAVKSGNADKGIIAIANNRYGFIPEPYSLLMADQGNTVQISAEHTIKIQHCLLGIAGSNKTDITEIHSQTPAIAQCRSYLEVEHPNATIVETNDTAAAAAEIAKLQKPHIAAIASKAAGVLNELEVLDEAIQDDENNLTRFLVIERSSNDFPKDANKSSILLETSNEAGSLADALVVFKEEGINLDLLHSQFVVNTDFTMQFWLEFDAGWQDERTKLTLDKLKIQGAKIKFLGTYRRYENGN